MTVRRGDSGRIVLAGECAVEEAEGLLELLQATPDAEVDWRACSRLHTSLVQVLLAAQPRMVGPCADPYLERWIAPLLARRATHMAADGHVRC